MLKLNAGNRQLKQRRELIQPTVLFKIHNLVLRNMSWLMLWDIFWRPFWIAHATVAKQIELSTPTNNKLNIIYKFVSRKNKHLSHRSRSSQQMVFTWSRQISLIYGESWNLEVSQLWKFRDILIRSNDYEMQFDGSL